MGYNSVNEVNDLNGSPDETGGVFRLLQSTSTFDRTGSTDSAGGGSSSSATVNQEYYQLPPYDNNYPSSCPLTYSISSTPSAIFLQYY